MSYKVYPTLRFQRFLKRLLKKYPSLKEELVGLIDEIEKKPQIGTSIGNSCYKIRLNVESKGKGKSGGLRAITYVYIFGSSVYLIAIYDKSEQPDISDKDLKNWISEI